jgi:ABC-type multidrug transport system fused ATPase/permease subunit
MILIMLDPFASIATPATFRKEMVGMLGRWAWCCAGSAISGYLADLACSLEQSIFVRNIRNALFKNILEQELEFFDSASTGVLISSLSGDVVFVFIMYAAKFNGAISQFSQAFGGLIISVIISWRAS